MGPTALDRALITRRFNWFSRGSQRFDFIRYHSLSASFTLFLFFFLSFFCETISYRVSQHYMVFFLQLLPFFADPSKSVSTHASRLSRLFIPCPRQSFLYFLLRISPFSDPLAKIGQPPSFMGVFSFDAAPHFPPTSAHSAIPVMTLTYELTQSDPPLMLASFPILPVHRLDPRVLTY